MGKTGGLGLGGAIRLAALWIVLSVLPSAAFEFTCGLDQDSIMWIGTRTGLLKLDKHSGDRWFFPPTAFGQSYDYVWSIAGDLKGGVWLGLNMGGLAHFDGSRWENVALPPAPGFSLQYVRVAVDRRGVLWVHGYERVGYTNVSPGLFRYDGQAWSTLSRDDMPLNPTLPNFSVSPWAMALDTAGQVWVMTAAGLYEYADSHWTLKSPPPGGFLYADLLVAPDGRKWAGGNSKYAGGVNVYQDDSGWTSVRLPGNGSELYFTGFAKDVDGSMWILGNSVLENVNGTQIRSSPDLISGTLITPARARGIYLARNDSLVLFRDSAFVSGFTLSNPTVTSVARIPAARPIARPYNTVDALGRAPGRRAFGLPYFTSTPSFKDIKGTILPLSGRK